MVRCVSDVEVSMVQLTPFLLFDDTNEEATRLYGSFLGRLGSHQSEGYSRERSDCARGLRQNHLRSTPGWCHHVSATDSLSQTRRARLGDTICRYLSGGAYYELRSAFDDSSVGRSGSHEWPARSSFWKLRSSCRSIWHSLFFQGERS